jgi:hypothetical protein
MAQSPNERFGACDLFGDQVLNQTGSGSGDREVFEINMRKHVPAGHTIDIFAKESSTLTLDETTRTSRLFHVDGGHSCQETFDDLDLASQSILDEGAVIVDDAFNEPWPGVVEGVVKFLISEGCSLVPLVIGFNKLVLVKPEAVAQYERWLNQPEFWQIYISPDIYRTFIARRRSNFAPDRQRSFLFPAFGKMRQCDDRSGAHSGERLV